MDKNKENSNKESKEIATDIRTEEEKEKDKHIKTIKKLVSNYANLEESIVNQLNLETPNYHLTTGTYREGVWKSLFEMLVPKKYCIDQGIFIIDSMGQISHEVDLAIFDEMYTPYIFNYGKIKFIPIEAVAVAIQCKSQNADNADEWADSIKRLRTSLKSVFRVVSGLTDNAKGEKPIAQTSTRPILILCTTGNSISQKYVDAFDILLNVDGDKLKKQISKKNQDKAIDLVAWYYELNHCGFILDKESDPKKEFGENNGAKVLEPDDIKKTLEDFKVEEDGVENVIMSLTFQLNQLIMLINNPIPFPHIAYVDMFNKIINGEVETGVEKEELVEEQIHGNKEEEGNGEMQK